VGAKVAAIGSIASDAIGPVFTDTGAAASCGVAMPKNCLTSSTNAFVEAPALPAITPAVASMIKTIAIRPKMASFEVFIRGLMVPADLDL